jgi:hypothetical protein
MHSSSRILKNILQLGFLPETLPIIAEEEEHHFRGQSLIESVSLGGEGRRRWMLDNDNNNRDNKQQPRPPAHHIIGSLWTIQQVQSSNQQML